MRNSEPLHPQLIQEMSTMKPAYTVMLLLVTLLNDPSKPSSPIEKRAPIFREIRIGGDKKIKLAELLTDAVKTLLDKAGMDCFRLRKGAFGGAETIEIFTTKEGRVKSIYFGYADGTDFGAMRDSYKQSLGKPQLVQDSESAIQIVRWEDANTALELVKHGSCIRVAMYDRPLSK